MPLVVRQHAAEIYAEDVGAEHSEDDLRHEEEADHGEVFEVDKGHHKHYCCLAQDGHQEEDHRYYFMLSLFSLH